jgi:hypothetical protein
VSVVGTSVVKLSPDNIQVSGLEELFVVCLFGPSSISLVFDTVRSSQSSQLILACIDTPRTVRKARSPLP